MADATGKLGAIQMFQGLDEAALADIEARCAVRAYPRGEMVIEKGDDGTDVYFVISGQLAVFTYADEAKQVFLREFFNGETFGEIAAIDGGARSAWVVAVADTVLASMTSEDFLGAVSQYEGMAVNALRHMARTLRHAGSNVHKLALLTPRQRICAELVKLAGAENRNFGEATINEMPSHDVVASFAFTEREIVAGTIGDLMREGIIARRKRSLAINDLARLHAAASGNEYDRMDNENGVRTLFDQIYSDN